MGTSGSHFKFSRLFLLGCSGALVLAAACGENPEVLIQGRPATSAGAGLGEACAETGDCATPLFCGPKKQCIGTCGDITSKSCGNEACLPSGLCSLGMGNDCSTDADCNAGLKCSGVKHCSVPCVPGAQDGCPNGDACRDDATCPTKDDIMIGVGGSGNQGTGGEDSGAAGASSCIDVNVEFTPQIPTVLFLIDRSLSMTNERGFGAAVKAAVDDGTYALGTCPTNNDWRWNVVRDVLMNPTKGLVKPLEDRVRFGLTLYSSHNGRVKPITMGMPSNPVELDPARECPELVNVPIALNNADAMLAQFGCSDLAVDTPTGESLLAVADSLKAFTEPGPKVIVLATDGEPDSCDCPNFDNITSRVPENCRGANAAKAQQDVKDQVVANAKAIHADDITVHVINVSTPGEASLQQHLQDVADAGGGNVYPGFSPGSLSDAFEDIIDGARSCVIDLNGEIAPGKESSGTLTLDGDELELDDADGWQVNSSSQIELLGAACDAIKKGGHDIAINFPCDSFIPPVH